MATESTAGADVREDAAAAQGWLHEGENQLDLERSLRPRRENVLPVDQPLALICQAQRSGGTLLAGLFDGHPQCHVHPQELRIGARHPHPWPRLKPHEDPEAWFSRLEEAYLA